MLNFKVIKININKMVWRQWGERCMRTPGLSLGGLELAYGNTPVLTSKTDEKSKGKRSTAVKPFKFSIATHPPH